MQELKVNNTKTITNQKAKFVKVVSYQKIFSLIGIICAAIVTINLIFCCCFPTHPAAWGFLIGTFVLLLINDIGWLTTTIFSLVYTKYVKNYISKKEVWVPYFVAIGIEIASIIIWSIAYGVIILVQAATAAVIGASEEVVLVLIPTYGSLFILSSMLLISYLITFMHSRKLTQLFTTKK